MCVCVSHETVNRFTELETTVPKGNLAKKKGEGGAGEKTRQVESRARGGGGVVVSSCSVSRDQGAERDRGAAYCLTLDLSSRLLGPC